MTKNKNDNIILFPTNKIVEKSTAGPVKDDKFQKKLAQEQTKQFIETTVDDISIELLRKFYNLAIKTNKDTFTKDLAVLVDVMRGLIYRDFDIKHPAQILSDKLVDLKKLKVQTIQQLELLKVQILNLVWSPQMNNQVVKVSMEKNGFPIKEIFL